MERGAVHRTLQKLAGVLDQQRIPYAIIKGMAMNLLGFTRETLDVDILLTETGLQSFQDNCSGRGYVPAFPGAKKSFRDTETNVKVEVVIAGEYPGDEKPIPVVFPDPETSTIPRGNYRVLALERLIELKLASGLSAPHRLGDLADVQDLIATLGLPRDLGEKLDPSVASEYLRLWQTIPR